MKPLPSLFPGLFPTLLWFLLSSLCFLAAWLMTPDMGAKAEPVWVEQSRVGHICQIVTREGGQWG